MSKTHLTVHKNDLLPICMSKTHAMSMSFYVKKKKITFVCQNHICKNTFVCQKHILRSKSQLYVKNIISKSHLYVNNTLYVKDIMHEGTDGPK